MEENLEKIEQLENENEKLKERIAAVEKKVTPQELASNVIDHFQSIKK
jgi:hypothetical protein